MIKHTLYITLLCLCFIGCKAQEIPTVFSTEALEDTFSTLEGESISFKNILENNKGETILIDVWASWCADCIKGLPKVKDIQTKYPNVQYVFLSLDKDHQKWKKGIKKYGISGQHYFMDSGWDGPFGKFIDLDWIPRYMIVDKNGEIKLFKAIKADNGDLINALN
ncbi:TlpA family protein disulfide reductase [Lacinutrix salivirga]